MTALVSDAQNRGVRSLLTGLTIDVAVALALAVSAFLVTADGWGGIEWGLLSFSVAKSVVQAVCAFVLRRWLDGTRLPTPLPPAPVPTPNDEAPS